MPSHRQESFVREEATAILSALLGGLRYGVKIRLPHALVMTSLFRKDLSSKQKVNTILQLVKEHATNLAAFATIYKTCLAILKLTSRSLGEGVGIRSNGSSDNQHSNNRKLGRMLIALVVDGPFGTRNADASRRIIKAGEPERPYHSFLAGAIGGYLVWGNYSSVNYQIVLYLASRIMVGVAKKGWEAFYQRPGHFRRDSEASDTNSILEHSQTYPIIAAGIWGIVMALFEESPHVLHRSLKKSMDEIYRLQLFTQHDSV